MRYRKMRANHSTARPTQLIVATCDTEPVYHKTNGRIVSRRLQRGFGMFCRLDSGVATRQSGTTLTTGKFFWEWVAARLDERRTTWIVAHDAGAVMQSLGLFQALDSGMIELDYPGSAKTSADAERPARPGPGGLFVVADPPTIIGIRDRAGRRATIIDTRNYVDCSMDDMAIFLDRLRVDLADENRFGNRQVERLAHDAGLVCDFILKLLSIWAENDLGMWRWTVGGLAMSAFRHRLMPHPPVVHDDVEIRGLERESYRGGEILLPFIGRIPGPISQVDVTSLYPHVMRCGVFPQKLVNGVILGEYRAGPPPGDPQEQIAEVALNTGNESYGLLTKTGIQAVCGRFTATLAGLELERAVADGWVVGWKRLAVYKCRPLFREFVDCLWPLRARYLEQGNKIGAKLIKLMLVSLYGKFGQFGYSLEARPAKIAPRAWQTWREITVGEPDPRQFLSIGERVFEELTNDNHPAASIAIASFVTSAARVYMREMRAIVGARNWFYQSCDSLLVNRNGLAALHSAGLIGQAELGKFRVETTAESCEVLGAHDYSVGAKRIVGWKSGQAVETSPGSWQQVEQERLKHACRHSPEEGYRVLEQRKVRVESTMIGAVGEDGWTMPTRLDWGPYDLPNDYCSASANDSPISSMRAAMSAGGTGGDCSTAKTTDRTA